MPFPKTEAEIIALAHQIIKGLTTNPTLAASPVDETAMAAKLDAFLAKRDEIVALDAQIGEKHDEKDDLLDDLTGAMQQVIDYLGSLTKKDATEMATIGVGKSDAPVKQPPGQPRVLEILSQTDSGVSLDWKNPADGGRVASYRVERRERPAGAWETCFATNRTDAVLVNQPKAKELEYRVVAYNSNGDSPPSNSVAAVL